MLNGVFAHVRAHMDGLGLDLPLDALYKEEAAAGAHRSCICIAPHGGGIEPWTRFMAQQVQERVDCDYWSAWVDFYQLMKFDLDVGEVDRTAKMFHVTSHHLCRHPQLMRELRWLVAGRTRQYDLAVAVHGKTDDSNTRFFIEVGGTSSLRGALCERLAGHGMDVRLATGGRAGRNPLNIVNLLGRTSIQIEIPRSYRRNPVFGHAIVSATTAVLARACRDGGAAPLSS